MADIVGNRVSRRELCRALNCCEDTIDNLTKRYNIPYMRLLNERYYDLQEFTAKVQRGTMVGETDAPRRGRPRKVRLPPPDAVA